MTTTKTAAQRYDEYSNDIALLIKLMQAELKAHAAEAKCDPENGVYAGDLGHTRSQLIEALAFLRIEEPDEVEQTLLEAHAAGFDAGKKSRRPRK